MIDDAAAEGAGLLVSRALQPQRPMFASRTEAFAIAEEVSGGADGRRMDRARGPPHRLHLVAGICERGQGLYNSAVVIGPDGYVGTFRKVHLWNDEDLFFEPGDLGFPVFHTPIGRIGDAICYDGWFPEATASARCRGRTSSACRPTGCRSPARPRAGGDGQHPDHGGGAQQLAVHRLRRPRRRRARPAVHGPEPDRQLHRLAVGGPASRDHEEILYAEANLAEARRKRNWNAYNQVLRDRRTDVYDEMLGSANSGWY